MLGIGNSHGRFRNWPGAPSTASPAEYWTTFAKSNPSPRNVRQFQKRRDAVIAELEASGERPALESVAQALGVTPRKYAQLSLALTASEVIHVEALRRQIA